MAIKIGGTTVIDDSRNLVNVTGFKTINSTPILGTGDIAATGSSTVSTTPQLTAYTPLQTVASTNYQSPPSLQYNYSVNYSSGLDTMLRNIVEPPGDALLQNWDIAVSRTTSTIPGPPDGNPPPSTGYLFRARLRSEYRSVT